MIDSAKWPVRMMITVDNKVESRLGPRPFSYTHWPYTHKETQQIAFQHIIHGLKTQDRRRQESQPERRVGQRHS